MDLKGFENQGTAIWAQIPPSLSQAGIPVTVTTAAGDPLWLHPY